MSEPTLLRQVCEANKGYLGGNPRILDPAGEPFLVIACMDPRLTGLLEPALGLPRNRAIVFRTAGNLLNEKTRDALRSVAVALYVKKAREIIVVGHTDCGMSNFSVPDVTETFRSAGIPRSAFGDDDLRGWFGAFASIRDNLVSSIECLRKSGIVPRDMKIHGLILETNQGGVEVIVDGDLAPATPAPPVAVVAPVTPAASSGEIGKKEAAGKTGVEDAHSIPPPLPPDQKPKAGPIVIGPPPPITKEAEAAAAPASLFEATMVLRDFLNREKHSQQMQKAYENLAAIWKLDKSPHRILSELEKISLAYESKYPNLPAALVYLKNAVKTGSADKLGIAEAIRRILY